MSDKCFSGNKTYRRGNTWISEVDVCVASPILIDFLSNFCVIQRDDLPSDHGPITITVASTGVDVDSLLARATSLGDSAALGGNATNKKLVRKPLRYDNTDEEIFKNKIAEVQPVTANVEINDLERKLTETLYSCLKSSVHVNVVENEQENMNLGRWERLLDDKDDARVWRAIDWRGDYSDTPGERCAPSDEEFKTHFESVLNRPPQWMTLKEWM